MPAGLTTATGKDTQTSPAVVDPVAKTSQKSVQPTFIDVGNRTETEEKSEIGDKVEVDVNGNEHIQQSEENRPRRTIRQLKNQINKRLINARQHFAASVNEKPASETDSQTNSFRAKQAKEIVSEVGGFIRQRFRSLSRTRRDSYELKSGTLSSKATEKGSIEAGDKGSHWWQPILLWKEDETKRQRKLTSVVPNHNDDPSSNISVRYRTADCL